MASHDLPTEEGRRPVGRKKKKSLRTFPSMSSKLISIVTTVFRRAVHLITGVNLQFYDKTEDKKFPDREDKVFFCQIILGLSGKVESFSICHHTLSAVKPSKYNEFLSPSMTI